MVTNVYKLYYFIFLLLVGSTVHAQHIKVTGKVIDNENKSVLSEANVLLKGNQIYAAITDESGVFNFNGIKNGEYVLQISYLGFESYKSDLKNIQNSVSFGIIHLKVSNTSLEEVVVEGEIPLAILKGDTVVYNADAYKTNPDADAEDLVKKMPGIIVADGKVQAQGEDVKKVYVDGKPFFDQDPTLALKSLPAEVIQNIKVFDEESEQAQFSGFDDSETSKVMDIITRTEMKNGQFGKLFIGGGYPDKYQLGANVNFFDEDRRISLIGQSNNINQQNFSNEDLLGVVGTGGRSDNRSGGRGGRSGGQGMSGRDFMVGQQSGISTTTAFGVNYSDSWSDKIKVAGSYFFNMAENEREQDKFQQYFTESKLQNQIYTESNNSNSINYNHRFHFKFNYNINDNNRLMIRPRISIQSNESESNMIGESWLNDTLLNQNASFHNSDRLGYNVSNRILFNHKFKKRGRTISLNLNISMNTRTTDRIQRSERIDLEQRLTSDSLNQYNDYLSDNNNISGKVIYTEPIGENSQVMLNVNNSITYESSDRKAYNFDYLGNSYQIFDTSLSNVFNSSYYTQQFGSGYKYRKGKNSLTLGLNYEHASLHSEQLFPEDNTINQTFTSILPNARFRFQISKKKNLNISYRSNSRAPSVEHLQNTIDNSNPLKLETGNPKLKPAYEHSVSLRYKATNAEKATVFFIMGSIRYANNYIGNHTWFAYADTLLNNSILLQRGGQFRQPINLNNYRNLRFHTTYGLPIKALKSNFNISASYTYSQSPGMINNVLSYSKNNIFSTGLGLSSNISENIDFTISSYTSYNNANSTLQEQINNSYLRQRTEIDLNFIFWRGITFRASAGSQYYYRTSQKEEELFVLLNMEVGKKLFKNQLGEIKVSVFDLLEQNKNISRRVTDAYVEDTRTNVIQRFVMLTFYYRLRNFGANS